ncbi:hypothetical protein NLJ89_g8962 [Agrocybe chaxingu]|uniref:Uncharacterized protein n=1 Tax=Agrocybe chaxingu TaxID=84603 RepID=A0A9W8MU05_9AGAR|nr:hypothetical protein NLJ89_g8962 [Agrocybe chaxingu]
MSTALNHLPAFTNFQEAVKGIQQVSYCTGAIPLGADASTIFYRAEGKPHYIDLAKASTEDLTLLAESCKPATFGFNKQDVFDETYRKAGKMGAADFAAQFHPSACGVVDAIRDTMLPAQDTDRGVKVEMYKLNVYGSDAAIHDVCKTLQLKASLKTLYRTGKGAAEFCLADKVVSLHFPAEYGLLGSLKDVQRDAILAYGYGDEAKLEGEINVSELRPVVWVTEAGELNSFEPAYVAYGNEAELDYAYAQLCLIANVGPVGNRATNKQP